MDLKPFVRCAWLAWILLWAAHAGAGPDLSRSMREDAQLADVCFVDARLGWAVGDRGVIWHTDDGGAHWRQQASQVDCRLSAVSFLNSKHGWAVGGFPQPACQATTGVLLRTRDGGAHWTCDHKVVLPALRRVKFFDVARGWAIGEPSALYPSGVFTTEDGGRSWAALPPAEGQSWLAGDFLDPLTGVLAGRQGALAQIKRRGIAASRSAEFGLRALRQVKLADELSGWLVGEGGLVLHTKDGGQNWQAPEVELPSGTRDHFDFSALEVRAQQCWIAGSPGTRVFHSADGGRNWSAYPTGQTLPIHDLAFVDDRHGWAVGELGVILGTRDGGTTWRRQRGGGSRAALLGVYSQSDQIPLELLAQLSADEGYLAAVELVNRRDLELASPDSVELPQRAHEAVVRTGGSAAQMTWRFPVRSADLKLSTKQLTDGWDHANDGHGLERLEQYLVGQIRMWRPDVVFTSAPDAGADAPTQLIGQLVLRAADHAADATRFSQQIAQAGLEPWKIQKIYVGLPPGQLGNVSVSSSQIASRLGQSLGQVASAARGLLGGQSAQSQGFRLVVDHVPQGMGQRDFFSGIPLRPGGDARRAVSDVFDQDIESLRRSAQARRNLHAILAQQDSGQSEGRYLADIAGLTKPMEPDDGADILFQLGQRYHQRGQWELAAESFDLLAQRYPKHLLAGAALVWLVQYYSSSEAEWRFSQHQQVTVQRGTLPAATNDSGTLPARTIPSAISGGNAPVTTATAVSKQEHSKPVNFGNIDERPARAMGYARQLEQLQPGLFSEPQIQFPVAAAQRSHGYPRQAQRYYLGLSRTRPHDAWWACAQGESWLAEPRGDSPKSIWKCGKALTKPHLDGKLDEPLWRNLKPVELRSAQRDDDEWPAIAMLAYDDEFLYLAASCRQGPGATYKASDAPRPRDADLSSSDRIELLIDLDRDWTSAYRLATDYRGWTHDSCWRDATWNPTWFVAARRDNGTWTTEAAIPIRELTGSPPQSKHVWAVGIQRVVPAVGFQSWTAPASPAGLAEGFGYLIFD